MIPAMAASSHGPKTGGPVEHNPVPPPLPATRRRTRSMAADESVADENARFALVARPLTDHQGDEACDDPQGELVKKHTLSQVRGPTRTRSLSWTVTATDRVPTPNPAARVKEHAFVTQRERSIASRPSDAAHRELLADMRTSAGLGKLVALQGEVQPLRSHLLCSTRPR